MLIPVSPVLKRVLALLLLLLAAACAPQSAELTPTPTEDGGNSEREVAFPTTDGLRLQGALFGSGSVAVVLAHMFPADATSWYPAARALAAEGYTALAFNFRGYGDSDGEQAPDEAVTDLRAAIDFLEEEGVERVALVGASMGGTASLVAASLVADPGPEVEAVVAVSAPPRFRGLDATDAAAEVEVPVLLLAATQDDPAREGLEALAERLPDARTSLYDGEGHGTNLLLDHPEALEEIVAFLVEHCPPQIPQAGAESLSEPPAAGP